MALKDSNKNKWFSLNLDRNNNSNSCNCGNNSDSCSNDKTKDGFDQIMDVSMGRRAAFKKITAGLLIGAGAISSSCSVISGDESKEKSQIEWEEYFKGNYKLMTNEDKEETVNRLVRSYELRTGNKITMSSKNANKDVLFGYAFNISKCQGYMDCVDACVKENNQDRDSQMRYIRIHEMKDGKGFNLQQDQH